MKNFQKLSEGVVVTPLLNNLYRKPELWKSDSHLRGYAQGPEGENETIYLRYPDPPGDADPEKLELYKQNKLPGHDIHECPWRLEAAEFPEARAHIMGLVSFLGATRVGRCVINRLRAGGKVFPHKDLETLSNYWSRYHLVLQSEPGNVFFCAGENVWMRPGELWWFNHGAEHEVMNNSANDRIHLVMDMRFR